MRSEEVSKILELIKNKKSIQDIAASQKKAPSYIKSKLKSVACEYYMNSNKPFNEIQQITGIKKEDIVIAKSKPQEPKVISRPRVESAPKEPVLKEQESNRIFQDHSPELSLLCIDVIIPALDTFIEYATYARNILKSIH